MKDSDQNFWPYKPKVSVISSVILLILFISFIAILHAFTGWPSDGATTTVLIGIVILGLLPILLAILDIIIDRGGTIGYGDFKIDFSKINYSLPSGIVIPPNIGGQGFPVNESSITTIIDALKKAGESDTVIVDIEDGKAWWETRLLLLVEGATRLGKPDKIVFLGTLSKQEQSFIGWATPTDLLPLLLNSNTIYLQLYHISKAATLQWSLVEPMIGGVPPVIPIAMGQQAGISGHFAFDTNNMPNEFLMEQILGNELGNQVEQANVNLHVTHGKLIDLFDRVLVKDKLDEKWATEQQEKIFFETDTPYLALTRDGKYLKLVPRLSIFNEIIKNYLDSSRNKKKIKE